MKPKTRKGAVAVETVLLTILFLVPLLYVMVDAGIIFYNHQVLTNASREGARAAKRTYNIPTPTEIDQLVNTYIFGAGSPRLIGSSITSLPADDITVVWSGSGSTPPSPSSVTTSDTVRVSVEFTYTPFLMSAFGFGGIDISASTIMRMEPPPL